MRRVKVRLRMSWGGGGGAGYDPELIPDDDTVVVEQVNH